MTRRTLLPFDYSRFPVSRRRAPPATHLDATTLVEALADEYLHAELHEAILLAFVAENEARLSAMIAAQSHLDTRRETLLGDYHRARQEAITEEIITLAASRL
ncbi:F0F1 ATP synthase subunit gamma [Modicisalibacter tunisiensis]|uniref:F0F1 ATP synthase subunit gamma n=1 Tax=Modicisalibacter tunisiensis TaxID=390637 RepID=A0ABS7WW08_9GAMM|nr:F0F1 ATP synthase subunit gamma [Modicisalibacter tunisiensis]MBZ9566785.1 F0F1 ATP synthase subunit gamma [Modicisalibacter tunisiensis]